MIGGKYALSRPPQRSDKILSFRNPTILTPHYLKVLSSFHHRKCLNTQTLCGRSGLDTHSVCGRSGLNTHSPFCIIVKLLKVCGRRVLFLLLSCPCPSQLTQAQTRIPIADIHARMPNASEFTTTEFTYIHPSAPRSGSDCSLAAHFRWAFQYCFTVAAVTTLN